MIARLALVGLSAAFLAGPARALDAPAPSSETSTAASEPSVAPTRRKRLRKSVRRAIEQQPADAADADTASAAPEPASTRSSRVARTWRGRPTLPPVRPGATDSVAGPSAEPTIVAAAPQSGPASLFAPSSSDNPNWFSTLFGGGAAQERGARLPPLAGRSQIDALIAHHARLNGVPEALVHRIVVRESKYNPRAVGRGGAMGLMQIKTATARGQGYQGGPAGLLDAETNITYAVKYLAGAYRVADGNHDRAVGYYARGYYYDARRKGQIQTASRSDRRSQRGAAQQEADATPQPAPASGLASFFSVASRSDDRSGR